MNTEKILCPSSTYKEGVYVLGERQDNGLIKIFEKPIKADVSFVESVKEKDIKPERLYRFMNKCVESGCRQWNGKSCGIAQKMMDAVEENFLKKQSVPNCSIRAKCRWYLQGDINACKTCTLIITEVTAEELKAYVTE